MTFEPGRTRSTSAFGLAISAIIAVGLGFALWSLRGGSAFAVGITVAVLGVLLALTLYLTASASRMAYELGENELKVHLGIGGMRIPYASIADAQRSSLTLTIRIFGGSWSGFHFGLFRASDVGNVTAYTTRMTGEFALLTLTNGRMIVLSPKDTAGFIEGLNAYKGLFGRAGVGASMGTGAGAETGLEPASKRMLYLQIAIVLGAYVCMLWYFFSVYPSLPQIIPVHFDLNMNPNRWGDKSELFILMGVAAIFPALNTIFCLKFGRYSRLLTTVMTVVFLLTVALFFGILHMTVSMI